MLHYHLTCWYKQQSQQLERCLIWLKQILIFYFVKIERSCYSASKVQNCACAKYQKNVYIYIITPQTELNCNDLIPVKTEDKI